MPFVVDASVASCWCFPDENSAAAADTAMDRLLHDEAIAPGLWTLEITNILISRERRGGISPEETDAFLGDLAQLPIRICHDADDRVLSRSPANTSSPPTTHPTSSLPRVPGPPPPRSTAGWPVQLAPKISRSLASSRTRYGAGTRCSTSGQPRPQGRGGPARVPATGDRWVVGVPECPLVGSRAGSRKVIVCLMSR